MKLAYEKEDRGYVVQAWYRDEPGADARIEIVREGVMVREFDYPAYRIWNIAAHFSDIVDDLLEGASASEERSDEAHEWVAPAGSGSRESRTTAGAAWGAPTGDESGSAMDTPGA